MNNNNKIYRKAALNAAACIEKLNKFGVTIIDLNIKNGIAIIHCAPCKYLMKIGSETIRVSNDSIRYRANFHDCRVEWDVKSWILVPSFENYKKPSYQRLNVAI